MSVSVAPPLKASPGLSLAAEIEMLINRAIWALREGYKILLIGFDGNANNRSLIALEPQPQCCKGKPDRGRTAALILHSIYGPYEGGGGWDWLPDAQYEPAVTLGTMQMIGDRIRSLVIWPKSTNSREAKRKRRQLEHTKTVCLRAEVVLRKPLTPEEQEARIWAELETEQELTDAWKVIKSLTLPASFEATTNESERKVMIANREKPLDPRIQEFARQFWENAGRSADGQVKSITVAQIAGSLGLKSSDHNRRFVRLGLIKQVKSVNSETGAEGNTIAYAPDGRMLRMFDASGGNTSQMTAGIPEPGTLSGAEWFVAQEPVWTAERTTVDAEEQAEIEKVKAKFSTRKQELDAKLLRMPDVKKAIAVIKGLPELVSPEPMAPVAAAEMTIPPQVVEDVVAPAINGSHAPQIAPIPPSPAVTGVVGSAVGTMTIQ